MQFRHYLTIFITTLVLPACSILQPPDYWPDQLPPQEYFIDRYQVATDNQAYQELDSYLNWIKTFYLGSALSPGWLGLTEDLLYEAPAVKKQEYEVKMEFLGRLIGAEWAKNNAVRLIDTRCASVWRDALIEAIERDDLENYMQRFEADVNAIFAGSLSKENIVYTRYYEENSFEFF